MAIKRKITKKKVAKRGTKKTTKRKVTKRKTKKKVTKRASKKTTKKKVAKRSPRKKTAKRRTTKRKTSSRRRKNPFEMFDGDAVLSGAPLSDRELRSLGFIADRYESGRLLEGAYDEDTGYWDLDGVAEAYMATEGDGGDIGTVPLAGDNLKDTIDIIFGEVFDHKKHLTPKVYKEFSRFIKKHRLSRHVPRR